MTKKKHKRISIALPEEDMEWLRVRYGDVGRGVRELVKDAKIRFAEPSTPTLKQAYRILLQHAEAPGVINWQHAREVIVKEMEIRSETFEELMGGLCREGFIRTIRTGILQVRQPGEPTWPAGLEAVFIR
ncbi:MAG: hypothetical protein ACE5NN_07845 [Candidatus Bathyarchaeia archaeon]